jgi:site-specific DNA-methyltransferase (adenine-specific)
MTEQIRVPKGFQAWQTPKWLFRVLSNRYGEFDLDACASAENALCPKFYTKEEDAIMQPWHGNVWCNPPYRHPGPAEIVQKCYRETHITKTAKQVVLLVNTAVDTRWFHQAFHQANHIWLFRGRIKFEAPEQYFNNGSPRYTNSLIVFNQDDEHNGIIGYLDAKTGKRVTL